MDHNTTNRAGGPRKRARLLAIAIFLFFLFSILILGYFKIQVLENEKWTKLAKAQHKFSIKEPFKRGRFYSNTTVIPGHPQVDEPFVIDVLKYHVHIDPSSIPESIKETMAKDLQKELNVNKSLYPHFTKKSRSRKVLDWVSSDDQKKLDTWWQSYRREKKLPRNALFFQKDYRRSYPFGKMLGQVLHTVRFDRDPKTEQAIATGGLELKYDSYLQGKPGRYYLQRSPKYELDSEKESIPAVDGADIYLTINHCLQAIVEEEVEKGVKKVNAKGGWAVMMDPYTGEILALGQYPSFDPSNYSKYFASKEMLEHTKVKAISDVHEPGSVMKPMTIAIALKANEELLAQGREPIFQPDEMVRTDISQFPGRSQPLRDVRLHHFLNMYSAVQKSSNVYPARLVEKIVKELGVNWYRKQLVEVFGFERKTGIEFPYESVGMVPSPDRYYASGAPMWSAPTPYSLAMGYNMLASSMQMVRAFAVIANGGYLVKPTFVRKIQAKDGKILLDQSAKGQKKQVLSEYITDEVVNAMKFVTKPGGTGYLGDVPGFTEAGKTGTCEKLINGVYSKTKHRSNFVGFAPANKPRFVLYIMLDEPEKRYIEGFGTTHFGGKSVAPIFREIAKRSLHYLGEIPDDPYGYPSTDPRADREKADWMDEVSYQAELYKKWNERAK